VVSAPSLAAFRLPPPLTLLRDFRLDLPAVMALATAALSLATVAQKKVPLFGMVRAHAAVDAAHDTGKRGQDAQALVKDEYALFHRLHVPTGRIAATVLACPRLLSSLS
jgi:hypothetical protein